MVSKLCWCWPLQIIYLGCNIICYFLQNKFPCSHQNEMFKWYHNGLEWPQKWSGCVIFCLILQLLQFVGALLFGWMGFSWIQNFNFLTVCLLNMQLHALPAKKVLPYFKTISQTCSNKKWVHATLGTPVELSMLCTIKFYSAVTNSTQISFFCSSHFVSQN